MSTVHALTTELSNLISQTKRRNTELRQASEQSLDVLRTFNGNEKTFLTKLSQDETFLSPFFMACATRNAKYSASALFCLQLLTQAKALPTSQLDQVLDALSEATNLGQEIQLKVLQVLMPMVQNYTYDLQDQLVAIVLQVCAKLQERKNNASVVSTASAIFSQINTALFAKVNTTDKGTIEVDAEHKRVKVSPAAFDALRIFIDLCHLLEKQSPLFLRIKELPETFILELLESIISQNEKLFVEHEEFAHQLRMSAVPTLLRFFTEKREFAVVMRVMRVLYKLLCTQLAVLRVECEVILSMFTQCMEKRDGPAWKRILSMEVFNGMCRRFLLVQELFDEYDMAKDRRNSITEMFAALDRICNENLKVIGHGNTTTQLHFQMGPNGDLADDQKVAGLSEKTSKARVLCIDMLDKSSAPHFPDSYMHYLGLTTLSLVSDGVNKTESGHFIESCWSQMLSMYTVFLNCTMDDTMYHAAVRDAQKLANAAGLAQLTKPRDAFMTLLGQCTIGASSLTTRNAMCLRALVNLGLALGPGLGPSWTILIETLQYTDAMLSTNIRHPYSQPLMFSGDFATVDASLKKLIESTAEYDGAALGDLLAAVCNVSALKLGLPKDSEIRLELAGIGKVENGNPCFLLDLLGQLGKVVSFDAGNWQSVVEYLIKVITNRQVVNEARSCAGGVLNLIAYQAMMDSAEKQDVQIRVLKSLHEAVERVIKLETPDEQQVGLMATESDIHVAIVDEVNSILGHCGGFLTTGWDTVLDIISSVFQVTANRDKTARLIKSGFKSFELICNDFLQSLPLRCLLQLIDILFKFCNQDFDLNTSFTANSFFWAVCDHLRSLAKEPAAKPITTVDELMKVVETGSDVWGLWMVALLRMTTIASNSHPQVRDGAITILFRVITSHGSSLPSSVWSTYQIVVAPEIMKIRPTQLSPEWVSTMQLIIKGVSNLYAQFAQLFINQDFDRLWQQLLRYYDEIDNSFESEPPALSATVYQGLAQVLEKLTGSMPGKCLQDTWQFWADRKLHNKVDPKVTQEALTLLAEVYQPLAKVDPAVAHENIAISTSVLERCISFQALPKLYSDRDHLSPLQKSGMKQLSQIPVDTAKSASLVLDVCANLIKLAFQPCKVPEHCKQPTFVVVCERTLKLVLEELDTISSQNFDELVENGTWSNVLTSVLIPMREKFNCPIIKIGDDQHSVQLWQLSTTIVNEIAARCTKSSATNQQIWTQLLDAITAILASTPGHPLETDSGFESFDVYMYKNLVTTLGDAPPEHWYQTLSKVLYDKSFFYTPPSTWTDTVSYTKVPGSTRTFKPLARHEIASLCIDELARLAPQVDAAQQWLDVRTANVLQQYIADRPLRGKMPMQSLVRMELLYVLKAHRGVEQIRPLLVRVLTVAANDHQVLCLVQNLFRL